MEDNTPADIINAVARIFGKFTKPSDDLSPVVFLRMPFEVIPVPILSSSSGGVPGGSFVIESP